jgi:putative glutathione S-transferase
MWKSKGLEETISLSIVDSVISEDGWKFSDYSGCIPDFINHAEYLREIYLKANPNYTGRVTVPVLWDREAGTVVITSLVRLSGCLIQSLRFFLKPVLTFIQKSYG